MFPLSILKYFAILLISALLVGCSSSPSEHDPSRLNIVTTIAPAADLIERIGGDAVTAHILLPQGNTPESYEPTPQDLTKLAHADAYLYMGDLGFERVWIDRIKELYPNLKCIRLDEGILNHSLCQSHKHTYSYDPHYWMSFGGSITMIDNITRTLGELYPEGKQHFDSVRLELNNQLLPRISQAPMSLSNAFVIYHPSLTYYAEEMGLTQLAIEQEGKDPSTRQIAELIAQAKEQNVRYVFVQQEFNPRLTESVASELNAQTIVINPLGRDWLNELLSIDSLLRH